MAAAIAPVMEDKQQTVLYGRYGGGPLPGAKNDKDLFPLAQRAVSLQVVEPGRPALTVGATAALPLREPAKSGFDLEPDDSQLEKWAAESRTLACFLTHSGELSHDDAVIYTLDLCAETGLKIGIGVHWQRYEQTPDSVQPMQTPREEGGALGLIEPVLHSSGEGVVAESLADPKTIASIMKSSRDRIAKLCGEQFAPRGVYCYCDVQPGKWDEPNPKLWEAVAQAGFEYLVTSAGQGAPKVLYRQGTFIVLNQCGRNQFPFSPFLRVREINDISDAERRQAGSGKPGWLIGVLDIPVHAYTRYLSIGRTGEDKLLRPRLGDYFEYLLKGGETGTLIATTPNVIARYARLLDDRGLI